MQSDDKLEWDNAMDDDMTSLTKNKTWYLVRRPKGQRVIGCKWVYRHKDGILGVEKARFKARLVAKGFSQREGANYNEIFSLVVKHISIRLKLSIVVINDLELEQLDVKTAFLHGDLEENILIKQPNGYEVRGKEDHVCHLKRSLYRLKQSPRQWYKMFDESVLINGYKKSTYDNCVYVKNKAIVYLLLYVDDMLIACNDIQEINKIEAMLNKEFEMKDLGLAKKILGIDIIRDRSKRILKLSQGGYISKILTEIVNIAGFVDSDYAGDLDTRRSQSGYVFHSSGCSICWKSNLQSIVALSTTEAEYITCTEAVKEALWLKGISMELGLDQRCITVQCDSQSALHLSKN
uniref:Reverse transcriptase Ty1/copia-type domain-containing protein n=1 Tax=Cannabis sativa TaxID=3483 RepID=A0A803QIL4_CANSA